ncbi:MAG: hypothetical protein ACYDB8_00555 [Acidiferrobacterales bacterium]
MPAPTRYLIHIRIRGPLTKSRIAVSAQAALDALKPIAVAPQELIPAYTSSDAGSFAFLIKTTDYAKGIRSKLDLSYDLAAEQILVVEIGQETAALNLGLAERWLQHH